MARNKERKNLTASKRLRIAREVLSLSQEKLAYNEKWGRSVKIYDPRAIRRWEKDGVPENRILGISSFFEVPRSFFIDPKIDDKTFIKAIELRYQNANADLTYFIPVNNDSLKDVIPVLHNINIEPFESYYNLLRTRIDFSKLQRLFINIKAVHHKSSKQCNSISFLNISENWALSESVTETFSNNTTAQQGTQTPTNAIDILNSEHRLVLLGTSGSGKTTCLMKFLFDKIENSIPDNDFVLYINMARYQLGESLLSCICYQTGINQDFVNQSLLSGNLRLLIDGLNECNAEAQNACYHQVNIFLNEWPNVPVIIALRDFNSGFDFGLPVAIIQPMERPEQHCFLQKHLLSSKLTSDILNRLYSTPGGKAIAQNPLFLYLISNIINNNSELPFSPALIYRCHLDQWYNRELYKLKQSGAKLLWTKNELFDKLYQIAFYLRINGYIREAPLSLIYNSNIGVASDQDFLKFVDQELICELNHEDDSFRFFHETFHSYLCAEYIIRNPKALSIVNYDIDNTWRSILAFVHELQEATKGILLLHSMRIDPILTMIMKLDIDISVFYNSFFSINTKALIDAGILDIDYFKRHFDDLMKESRPESAALLIEVGLAKKEDFADKIPEWINKSDPKTAKRLIRAKLAFQADFIDRLPDWFSRLNPFDLRPLIDIGLATKDDFIESAGELIQNTKQIGEAEFLISLGLAKPDDFSQKCREWIQSSSVDEAMHLILLGFATRDDFKNRISEWVIESTPKTANRLIQYGFATKSDFICNVDRWIRNSKPEEAKILIQLQMADKSQFENLVPEWIRSSTPEEALSLIRMGFTDYCHFHQRLHYWINNDNPFNKYKLIKYGFANHKDFER